MRNNILAKSAFFYKFAQDPNAAIRQVLEETLKGIPGCKLVDMQVSPESKRVDAKISVPQQHSFTASQLGKTLSDALSSTLPGYQVVPLLTFDTPKTAQDNQTAAIRAALENTLKGMPGCKLLDMAVSADKRVDAKIEVPQAHNFTASSLGQTLSQAVGGGYKVVPILSFSTKTAQDKQAAAKQMIEAELKHRGMALSAFHFYPDTKQIMIEAKSPKRPPTNDYANALGVLLTNKLQGVLAGFTVVSTVSF